MVTISRCVPNTNDKPELREARPGAALVRSRGTPSASPELDGGNLAPSRKPMSIVILAI